MEASLPAQPTQRSASPHSQHDRATPTHGVLKKNSPEQKIGADQADQTDELTKLTEELKRIESECYKRLEEITKKEQEAQEAQAPCTNALQHIIKQFKKLNESKNLSKKDKSECSAILKQAQDFSKQIPSITDKQNSDKVLSELKVLSARLSEIIDNVPEHEIDADQTDKVTRLTEAVKQTESECYKRLNEITKKEQETQEAQAPCTNELQDIINKLKKLTELKNLSEKDKGEYSDIRKYALIFSRQIPSITDKQGSNVVLSELKVLSARLSEIIDNVPEHEIDPGQTDKVTRPTEAVKQTKSEHDQRLEEATKKAQEPCTNELQDIIKELKELEIFEKLKNLSEKETDEYRDILKQAQAFSEQIPYITNKQDSDKVLSALKVLSTRLSPMKGTTHINSLWGINCANIEHSLNLIDPSHTEQSPKPTDLSPDLIDLSPREHSPEPTDLSSISRTEGPSNMSKDSIEQPETIEPREKYKIAVDTIKPKFKKLEELKDLGAISQSTYKFLSNGAKSLDMLVKNKEDYNNLLPVIELLNTQLTEAIDHGTDKQILITHANELRNDVLKEQLDPLQPLMSQALKSSSSAQILIEQIKKAMGNNIHETPHYQDFFSDLRKMINGLKEMEAPNALKEETNNSIKATLEMLCDLVKSNNFLHIAKREGSYPNACKIGGAVVGGTVGYIVGIPSLAAGNPFLIVGGSLAGLTGGAAAGHQLSKSLEGKNEKIIKGELKQTKVNISGPLLDFDQEIYNDRDLLKVLGIVLGKKTEEILLELCDQVDFGVSDQSPQYEPPALVLDS